MHTVWGVELTGKALRWSTSTSIFVVLLALADIQPAQSQVPTKDFNVPAQSATTGIPEFARQAGIQILVSEPLVRGKRIAAVTGSHSVPEALAILLRDTGLSVTSKDGATYTVAAAQPPPTTLNSNVASGMVAASQMSAQSVTADESPSGIEEIIVTAQHEAQELSKTPVAITAITGADLQKSGVTSTAELTGSVPNFSIIRTGNLQITIRGVTSNDATEKGDPSTAFMMDGVYIARPQAQDVSFFDVNRVEVLRGPQGTLWGRNTTAGLVHVITNTPEHKDSAALNFSYGSYNSIQTDGMLNMDLGPDAAVRASFATDKRNSYFQTEQPTRYDTNPDRDNTSLRLQGLFNLSDRVNLLLRGDYSRMNGSVTGLQNTVSTAYDISNRQYPVRKDVTAEQLLQRGYSLPVSARKNDDTWGLGAELNWDLGPAEFTYVGSYRQLHRKEDTPILLFGVAVVNSYAYGDYWQNSQEFRVATKGDGPFKAQAGLYYFKELSYSGQVLNNFGADGVFGFPQGPTISESFAGFGQATYSVTPSFRATAGVRYTHDEKSRDGATIHNVTPGDYTVHFDPAVSCAIAAGQPGGPAALDPVTGLNTSSYACLDWADRIYTKTTWRAGLEADVAPDTLLYGNIATGYKAGGFGDGCDAGASDPHGNLCNQVSTQLYYNPENLTAYEVGLKGKVGHTLRYSTTVFYYNYTDLQLSGLGNVGGGPSQVTTNAGKASVTGLEVEGTIRLTDSQHLNASATYTDAKYKEYLDFYSANDPTKVIDFNGRPLDRSPKETFALTYSLRQPVGEGNLDYRVAGRYSASYVVTDYSSAAQYLQPSYTKFDASVAYSGANDKWYVRLFGRNLTNEIQITNADPFLNLAVSEPRTYGVGLGLKF